MNIQCIGLFVFVMFGISKCDLKMNYYTFSNDEYCRGTLTQTRLLGYGYRRGYLGNSYVENNSILWHTPQIQSFDYTIEAVRRNISSCSYCPYHHSPPETFSTEFFLEGGIRYDSDSSGPPMYGPCLNGAQSKKLMCVQNQILYPGDFVGEYFYPNQMPLSGISYPQPYMVYSSSNYDLSWVHPSLYGLGKQNVQGNLDLWTSNDLDTSVLLETAKSDYKSGSDGHERWLKWAQFDCMESCHRDAYITSGIVLPKDVDNMTTRIFLKRYNTDGSPANINRCIKCSEGHASYRWTSTLSESQPIGSPISDDLRRNWLSQTCFPWFGSVPIFSTMGFDVTMRLNSTVYNTVDTTGIRYPAAVNTYESYACAPDTYNDVCAHTMWYWKIKGMDSNASCKACPAGKHTYGKHGSWFCAPQRGRLMVYRVLLRQFQSSNNQSMLWSRRDYLGYEFECGYLPSHCRQCLSKGQTNMLPHEFNQKYIFDSLLLDEPCPSTFYCPDPLYADGVPCPVSFPWSESGSFHVGNCTCAKGTFYNSSEDTCKSCPSRTSCANGQYLAGWSACSSQNGMKSGGTCVACTNKPENSYYTGGSGLEVGPVLQFIQGLCSFTCNDGFMLVRENLNSEFCYSRTSCVVVGIQMNVNGNRVYSSALSSLRDTFIVETFQISSAKCSENIPFSSYIKNSDKSTWPLVSGNCQIANSSACTVSMACMVKREASYANDYVCVPCRDTPLPERAYFTSDALTGPTNIGSRSLLCEIRCVTSYYYNSTLDACLSCSSLESLVCPFGYKIRGMGCLQDFRSFDTKNLSSGCTLCSLLPSNAPPNYYLDYNRPSGCEYVACTVSVSTVSNGYYLAVPCGGDNSGRVEPWVSSCASNQYLQGTYSSTSTKVCYNCTEQKKGWYKVAECSRNTEDSLWAFCPVNFFCDGYGTMSPCPDGMISKEGQSYASDCFCPVGSEFNGATSRCQRKFCDDKNVIGNVPGDVYTSSSYMVLNSDLVSDCVPCGHASSFSVGDGVQFSSCVCPFDYYAVVNSTSVVSCNPCSSFPTCSSTSSSFLKTSGSCWSGTFRGSSSCECTLPPFATSLSYGCAISSCSLGFNVNQDVSSIVPSENTTGSSLYITREGSKKGWTELVSRPVIDFYSTSAGSAPIDFQIRNLATTSSLESGDPNHVQYVLWTIVDRRYNHMIWTSPLPPLVFLQSQYNSYNLNPKPWTVLCSSDINSRGVRVDMFTVASWPRPIIISDPNPSVIFTSVHALVSYTESQNQSVFQLFSRRMSLDDIKNAKWNSDLSCGAERITPVSLTPYSVPVSIHHLYTIPGNVRSSTDINQVASVLIGYNDVVLGTCGIYGIRYDDASFNFSYSSLRLDLTSSDRRYIQAFTATYPSLGTSGIVFYVTFSANGREANSFVKLIRWSTVQLYEESFEVFRHDSSGFSRNAVFTSILALWPTSTSMSNILALIQDEKDPQKNGIFTSDSIQRTLTPVQGIPRFSALSSMNSVITGTSSAVIVGAFGSSIYTINLGRCSTSNSKPRYWDGSTCVVHYCERARQCSSQDGSQEWNSTLMRCVCARGYYRTSLSSDQLQCRICPKNSYCSNQVMVSCPLGLITASTRSYSPFHCMCDEGYYFDNTRGQCLSCPVDKWCPDNWNAISCPGSTSDIFSARMTGTVYPTSCFCPAGFIGPNCAPCPSGKYCPQPLNVATDLVTNFAVRIYISEFKLTLGTASVNEIEGTLCSVVMIRLHQLFSLSSISYLKDIGLFQQRFWCKLLSPDHLLRGNSILMIMLQLNKMDSGSSLVSSMVSASTYTAQVSSASVQNLGSYIGISQILPSSGPAQYDVQNNTELLCGVGKTPNENRIACVCDRGYQSSGARCIACQPGTFKPSTGIGSCTSCNLGQTSGIGAFVCIDNSNSNGGGNIDLDSVVSNKDTNTALIAGGAVGGVLLVSIFIYAYMRYMSS